MKRFFRSCEVSSKSIPAPPDSVSACITSNIASHLAVMAEQQPTRDAVVYPAKARWFAAGDLPPIYLPRTGRNQQPISQGFGRMGIRRGMQVALMAPPSLNFLHSPSRCSSWERYPS